MGDVPSEWLPGFDLIKEVIAGSVRLPFDPREPVPRLPADIQVEFERKSEMRAVISTAAGNVVRLPLGAYLRCRTMALAIAKLRSGRRIPDYFRGRTASSEQVRDIIAAMRAPFPSVEALLSETDRVLAAIGNEEPHPFAWALLSEAEAIAYFALNFLAIHEACHYWYGHFGLIQTAEKPFLTKAHSVKEVQADIGAGTSLASHAAADLEENAIPQGSARALARIFQLSELAGLAMAMTFDLIDTLHPRQGSESVYESYGVRLAFSHIGFRNHLAAKCGQESGEWAVLGLSSGEMIYSDAAGRIHDDLGSRARRVAEILSSDEFAVFADRQVAHIPNTPDLAALQRHAQAEAEAAAQYDPKVAGNAAMLFLQAPQGREPHPFRLSLTDANVEDETSASANEDARASEEDTLWRNWIDPLQTVRSGLANATVDELRKAAGLVAGKTGKPIVLWPDSSHAAESWVTPLDPAFRTFRISFGRGLAARLPLILRCLFDYLPRSSDPPPNDPYAVLTGSAKGSEEDLRWWAGEPAPPDAEESYELRNGWRYGLLFLLLRAAVRIHRAHFAGLERAMSELDESGISLVRQGLHLDADLYALWNVAIYIGHFADLETAGTAQSSALHRILVRGMHLRAAFFGIFTVLSCLRAASGDSPATRLALAVKSMDRLRIPTNGEPLFFCFTWIRAVPPFAPKPRNWDWSDFLAACFTDWDERTSALLTAMRDKHGLPGTTNPFIGSLAPRFDEPAFERFESASALAARYVDDSKRVLIDKIRFAHPTET